VIHPTKVTELLFEMEALRTRCAELEGERDAALNRAREARETAENYLGHCDAACKQLEVVEAERDAAKAEAEKDLADMRRFQGLVIKLTQDLFTASAGEARAVEALRKIRGEEIKPDDDGLIEDTTCCYCDANSADGCDEDCPRFIADEALSSAQPAPAWLAQVKREAAAEAWIDAEFCRSLNLDYGPDVVRAVEHEALAALLRASAALWWERDRVRWCQTSYVDGRWIGIYRQFAIEIVRRPTSFLWDVWEAETGKARTFNNHSNTLDAAKAAAIAWVDGQEAPCKS
jgi:hypothetical protein